ncbi:hypothetical protein KJE20_14454 [Pyrenophora tritici-repentis]|nr:hypothetical protein KJE20_14454 [Pyrenophora tritici-repentis]
MSPAPNITIKAKNVGDDEDLIALGRVLQNTLPSTQLATYVALPDDLIPCTAFAARTPSEAFRWFCQNVPRPKLLKLIQYNYDHPYETVRDVENDCVDDITSQERELEYSNVGTPARVINANERRQQSKLTKRWWIG